MEPWEENSPAVLCSCCSAHQNLISFQARSKVREAGQLFWPVNTTWKMFCNNINLLLIFLFYSICLHDYTSSIATSGVWSPNSVLITKVAALYHLFVYDLAFAIRRIERLEFQNFIEKHTSCNTMICILNWRPSRKWLVPIPVNYCFLQYDSAATKTGKDNETFVSTNRR